MEFPMLFEGDEDRGAAVVAQIAFPVSEEGIYWFDVSLFNEDITRMPLRVLYQRNVLTMGGPKQ